MMGPLHIPTPHSAPALRPDEWRSMSLQQTLGRKLGSADPRASQVAATSLTSHLFFAPLLAEMRKFPIGQDFLREGRTEAVFGEELDRRIADLVSRNHATGISAQIADKLSGQGLRKRTDPRPRAGDGGVDFLSMLTRGARSQKPARPAGVSR